MGTSKLNSLLIDKGIDGVVMRKVMDATVRYNPRGTDRPEKLSKQVYRSGLVP